MATRSHQPFSPARLVVVAGCMSSGKTTEMMRLLRRAEIARRRVLLVRPLLDDRQPIEEARSRLGLSFPSCGVSGAADIATLVAEREVEALGIDEAQFFGPELVSVVNDLVADGISVIACGLNTDFLGRPFGPMGELMATADEVFSLTAICTVCGAEASRSQRLVNGLPAAADAPLIVVGGLDETAVETYEARCRLHHEV